MQREADAKCDKIRKEADTEFNEIQTDVSKLEQTMKEKEAVLELDLAYFKFLYNGKVVQEHEWSAHMYWCRRKFWQHYYRADPASKYPELPVSPENQLASLRNQFANHNPPWWFPGFPNVERHCVKYQRGWKHYENDIVPPKSPEDEERDAEDARLDIERWTLMSTEQIEGHIQDSENYCTSEREKINAATEVVEEYSEAIERLKRRCVRWQKHVDHQSDAVFRAKSFFRLRRAEELTSCDKEPDRKKRRIK
ncbi:hypothetical protein V491_08105 [Pseudogymnoascus sp. VKM F-3775]|nr:hypothetical protein V491_08105 [Pseudogymnoascus sp. VKM F-3775]